MVVGSLRLAKARTSKEETPANDSNTDNIGNNECPGIMRTSYYLFLALCCIAWFPRYLVDADTASVQIYVDKYHQSVAEKCDAFVEPLISRRKACLKETPSLTLNICVNFRTDVEYILSFVMHYLALGVNQILIYNRDEELAWYHHPAIVCLIAKEILVIQPWYGENIDLQGYDHCTKTVHKPDTNTWVAALEIDEFVVLHEEKCLNTFLSKKKGPGFLVNSAIFVPNYPLSGFHFHSGAPVKDIVLPHELITSRYPASRFVKTIAQASCIQRWKNGNLVEYKKDCPLGIHPTDATNQISEIINPTVPPSRISYKEIQLNHYWVLSLRHYFRQMHQPSLAANPDELSNQKSTDQFFEAIKQNNLVNDTSFLQMYGNYFQELKTACLDCFNISLYYQFQ